MSARIDLSGQRFGRLTALSAASWGPTTWFCKCDCGTEITVRQGNIRNGHTQSCGCLLRENEANLTHGHTRGRKNSRTFGCYSNAKNRCFNPKNQRFADYGGRGIVMCDRWRDSFADFLEDMGECPQGKSLERKDVHGNYEPSNCKWATPAEQARNKRNNIIVEVDGGDMILKDFAALKGVEYHSLHSLSRYHGEPPQVVADRMLARKFENVARIIKR